MKRILWLLSLLVIVMITETDAAIPGSRPAAGFNLEAADYYMFGDATIGGEFTANSDVLVTDLGWIDTGTLGLDESHEVGIFDKNQVLLVSTIVQAGETSIFTDGFRYEPIEPITLVAGKSYVVAGRVGDADNIGISAYTPLPPEFTLDPEISLVGGRTNGGHDLFNYPGNYFRADRIYMGPNFQLVPEPATFLLFGLGGLALRRCSGQALRRKHKA